MPPVGELMSQPEVYVVTADVRRSADAVDVVADDASSSRAAVADGISGDGTAAWKGAGRAGFSKFVDILDAQAGRLRADLTDLGAKLRTAADAYDTQDHEAGGALDSSVRYD
jgi:uncharacterized protein YukE